MFALTVVVLLALGCEAIVPGMFEHEPGETYERLTDDDIARAATNLQKALESGVDGETMLWSNERTGRAGAVMPLRTFVTEDGDFCRDYLETLVVDSLIETFENTGCRVSSGVWHWVR